MQQQPQHTLLFTGAYAEADQTGICVYAVDETSGELRLLDEVSGIKNPTFLNVDPAAKRLYAIGEISDQGKKAAEIVTFEIQPDTGKLKELSRVRSVSSSTCHIQRDEGSSYLIVSSYHGGWSAFIGLTRMARPGSCWMRKSTPSSSKSGRISSRERIRHSTVRTVDTYSCRI